VSVCSGIVKANTCEIRKVITAFAINDDIQYIMNITYKTKIKVKIT